MSELKAFDIVVAEEYYCEGIVKYRRAVYDKSEADNVIAEKDAEIARLKAVRKVHIEAITSMGSGLQQDEEEILHQKYKRCLAMAVICFNRAERANCWKEEVKSRKRFEKWRELAEKFKEAK